MKPTRDQIRQAMLVQGATAARCDALLGPLRAPKPRGPGPEAVVLKAVLGALRVHPSVAWAARINSGTMQLDDRWVKFNSMKGMSDVIGMTKRGTFIAIECKAAGKNCTEDQAKFLRLVADHGGIAIVARSAADLWAGLPR